MKSEAVSHDRFQRFVCKMLVTFVAVVLIDVVAVSLLTHRLRFWFPVWLDTEWATRPDPWVVYSQSYFAGIFFIPLLAHAVDRDLLTGRVKPAVRGAFWGVIVLVFAFILTWKGELMLRFGKQWEALGWLAMTTAVWTALSIGERIPVWLEGVTPRRMMQVLARGISVFFLGMAVLDPALQLGVQHLAVSNGLIVEVSFFVPAGIVLAVLSRRRAT